jgi:hypothetical protein
MPSAADHEIDEMSGELKSVPDSSAWRKSVTNAT